MYPVLFKIGTFEVRSFGVMMVLAFLAAIGLARRRAARYGYSTDAVNDVSFWTLMAGVFGARLFFIAQDWAYFSQDYRRVLTLRFEGLTSFGGLVMGAVAAFVWARVRGASVSALLDLLAPAFLLGHVFGRFGCLLNGCCFGGVCPPSVPWGIRVPGSDALHHPAQVYDALFNLAALAAVLAYERRSPAPLRVTGLALGLHGLARFVYEFWRAGTPAQVEANLASSTYWGSLPITEAQAMAAAIALVGLVLVLMPRRRAIPPSTEPAA